MCLLPKYSHHLVHQGAFWKSDGTSFNRFGCWTAELTQFSKTYGFSVKMGFDLKKQFSNLEVIQYFCAFPFFRGVKECHFGGLGCLHLAFFFQRVNLLPITGSMDPWDW